MTTQKQFAATARPTYSHWGQVDHATEIAPGIWSVSTPGHGGIILSAERRAAMPKHLRDVQTFAGGNSYEEDCDWAIVALAFPEHFKAEHIEGARRTLESYDHEPKGYEIGVAYYATMRAAAQALKQTELAL